MDSSFWLAYWERLRRGTRTTIDSFLDDELGFAPVAGGYTIREICLHIAHEEVIEIHHGFARLVPDVPEPYRAADFPSRDSIIRQLEGVHTQTVEYLAGLTEGALLGEVELAWGERLRPVDVILHVMEHEGHHRGELSLALGLLGRRGFDA